MTREERQQALAEERRCDHEKLVAFGDDELIESWHSNTPTRLLAIKYGVRSSSLAMEWRRLQRADLLPLHNRAQHEPSDTDGRPAVTFGDPLLERLRKVHGSWLLGLLVAPLLTTCQFPLRTASAQAWQPPFCVGPGLALQFGPAGWVCATIPAGPAGPPGPPGPAATLPAQPPSSECITARWDGTQWTCVPTNYLTAQ